MGYRNIEPYAERKGFVKQQNITCQFSWTEIGALEETQHPMNFWIKEFAR